MAKVSVIIPSRNEEFLSKTVDDIFAKARGEFEVIVILDEKDQPLEPRPGLIVKKKEGKPGLRSAMNQAIALATGKYIMKTDAHCMFGEGFDTILAGDMEDNWVSIPRRYSLIPETWEINPNRPIVDYEYYVFPYRNEEAMSVKTGGKWHDRTAERKDILIDDNMAFQGSCWFTTKQHLENIGGFSIETSTGDEFVLESEELANKTWLSGGRVIINKKTWYAHLHKGSRGRGYFINKWPMKRQRLFHTDYWMHDRWPKAVHKMEWLVEKFMPIPGWPEDWKDKKYELAWQKANGVDRSLTVIIPARNEMFLKQTINNILENIEGDTKIIAILDGYWPIPAIEDHPRVTLIHHSESIGQRAATNEAVRMCKSKYVMKVDAHCAFDKGFDVKMTSLMKDNYTMIPVMRNLHAFDWVCPDGHRRYQGPSGVCTDCGKETTMDIKWIAKKNPQSTAYRFDREMHFQYWNEFGREQNGDLTETMSIQGSCFMVTRDKYLELDLCSEDFHSWGQQGVEVACKTWLSGGRVVVNRTTWYAHMFRTQGGDFSFPYENPGSKVVENRKKSRELFVENKWDKAVHSFQWLINKFQPPEWESNLKKSIIFYTDNRLPLKIAHRVQDQLSKISKEKNIPIISSSLKPMPHFGNKNVCLPLMAHTKYELVDGKLVTTDIPKPKPGLLTMTKQIISALKATDADIVYFCEHDVLYHPSHFDFTPSKPDVYYYNTNSWMLRAEDGHALYYDHRSLSGMCCYRETAIKHYEERLRRIEALEEEASKNDGLVHSLSNPENTIPLKEGIHRLGFEPGTHNRPDKIDDLKAENYASELPNVDVRHNNNLTNNRWKIEQFRTKPTGWVESDEVPGWGKMRF